MKRRKISCLPSATRQQQSTKRSEPLVSTSMVHRWLIPCYSHFSNLTLTGRQCFLQYFRSSDYTSSSPSPLSQPSSHLLHTFTPFGSLCKLAIRLLCPSPSSTTLRTGRFIDSFIVLLFALLFTSRQHSSFALIYDGTSEYQAVEGDTVSLPCNISTGEWNEAHISLVVWYRSGNQGNPIYSIDARNTLTSSRHQVTPELNGRVRMDFHTRPPVLLIDTVSADDAGDYRCRVDYRMNRTQQFLIHLNISIPPKEIVIRDFVGNVVQGMTGIPYNEGDKVALFCDAIGGNPPPVVMWRSNDGKVIDDSYEQLSSGTNVTRNSLVLTQIDRSNLLQELTCEAFPPIVSTWSSSSTSLQSNARRHNHSAIRRTSLVLDLNLKPLVVQIQVPNFQNNLNRSLTGAFSASSVPTSSSFPRVLVVSAGRKTEIECRTWGSRPPAQITWWRGSRRLPTAASRSHFTNSQESESTVSANDATNLTVSILSYTAAPEDDGQKLTCRADNLQLTNEEIEDSVIISVRYAPQLSLSLGAKIPDTIREGSDVYFECLVRANPPLSEVVWLFEGRPLLNDPVSGVLLTNQSLVMQRVHREHRGHYQCIATNAEGISASNKVFLNVHFSPVCKPGQTIIYGVARTEHVIIPCEVEAEPVSPITFRWFFNNSLESFELPKTDYTVELIKTPTSALISEHGKPLFTSSTLLSQISLESVLNSIAKNSNVPNRGPSVARSNATYSPRTRVGYGTLYCLAENPIGIQRDPCSFGIVEAGPPNSVHDCRIVNVTMASFVLECNAGENGGLRQIFHLEVYNIEKEHLQVNVTSLEAPVFTVENLPHDTAFTLNVFSSNAKGRSDSVTLRTATTAHAEKHTTNGKKQGVLLFDDVNDLLLSPMFGAMVGVCISLLLLCGATVVFVRHRVCTSRPHIDAKDVINSNGTATPVSNAASLSEQIKDGYGVAHSSTMPTVNEYLLRPHYPPEQHLNSANYFRYQSHTGTLPLLHHSHGLLSNVNAHAPGSDSLALTEMSVNVNHQLEPSSYFTTSSANFASDSATILHHTQQQQPVPSASDLMTNAFTYNVATSSARGIYPISSDLLTMNGDNSAQRTYTEIGSTRDISHHVAALGPMVGCIDSLSSSTSDKTAEIDEEWRLSKHHSHGACTASQLHQQPYTSYANARSNEPYISSSNTASSSPNPVNQPKVHFSEQDSSSASPSKKYSSVTSV